MKYFFSITIILATFLLMSCPAIEEKDQPEIIVLSPPSGLLISAEGSDTFNLEWTYDSGDDIDGFILQRSNSDEFSSPTDIEIANNSLREYSDEDLAVGEYYYHIQAYKNQDGDSINTSAWSDSASGEITAIPEPPDAPELTGCTAADVYDIEISWNDNSSNETGFYIQYVTEAEYLSNGFSGTPTQISAAGNATSETFTVAVTDETYYVRIGAYNSEGSSWSAPMSVTLTSSPQPDPPTNFTGEKVEENSDTYVAGEGVSVLLKWTDSPDETEYILQRSTSAGFGTYDTFTLPENTDVYIDTSTAGGTEYFYRLYASNGTDYSTEVTTGGITTDADPGQPVVHIYRKGQNGSHNGSGHIVYNIWITNGTQYQNIFKSENYGYVLNFWSNTMNTYGDSDQIDATSGPTESNRFGHTSAEDYTHSLILDSAIGTEFDIYYETHRSWEHNDWFESSEAPSLVYKAHVDLHNYTGAIVFELVGFGYNSATTSYYTDTRYITHSDNSGSHEWNDSNTHVFGDYDTDNPARWYVYPFQNCNNASYAIGSDDVNYDDQAKGGKFLFAAIHQ